MSEYPKSERQPVSSWVVDRQMLESVGIKPGVYTHTLKGGEYLTLTVEWRMEQDGADESVGEQAVSYVALYDHPLYGPNAIWNTKISKFIELIPTDDGPKPRFRFLRATL